MFNGFIDDINGIYKESLEKINSMFAQDIVDMPAVLARKPPAQPVLGEAYLDEQGRLMIHGATPVGVQQTDIADMMYRRGPQGQPIQQGSLNRLGPAVGAVNLNQIGGAVGLAPYNSGTGDPYNQNMGSSAVPAIVVATDNTRALPGALVAIRDNNPIGLGTDVRSNMATRDEVAELRRQLEQMQRAAVANAQKPVEAKIVNDEPEGFRKIVV